MVPRPGGQGGLDLPPRRLDGGMEAERRPQAGAAAAAAAGDEAAISPTHARDRAGDWAPATRPRRALATRNTLPEIEARISDGHIVMLRIHCEDGKGVLFRLLAEVEGLRPASLIHAYHCHALPLGLHPHHKHMAKDGEVWTFSIRSSDTSLPDRIIHVNYDCFAEVGEELPVPV